MHIPEDILGGDLIWWRETASCHTVVTIWGGARDLRRLGRDAPPEVVLLFRLHDPSGKLRTSWTQRIRPGLPIIVDSRNYPGILEEGVLAIFSTAEVTTPKPASPKYHRLMSMVDWYSDQGDLVSLHSDHSVSAQSKPIHYTEIVFLETTESENFLVLLNGPQRQRPGSVALEVRNHRGDARWALYDSPMEPFSLHKLSLRRLFPGLNEFCEGHHATLEGRFDAKNVFSRPYVMTEGKYLNGYHGGNLYQWSGIPRFVYRALGQGEVNPMVALHTPEVTTTVNLLNSHGDLEEDFWIDARLYDESGREVANRKKWLLSRRNGLSRGEVKDLIGNNSHTFIGHIALNFSEQNKLFYPRRLQALLEYRTTVSTARVMAWSDIWNGRPTVRRIRDQLAGFWDISGLYGERVIGLPGVTYGCHYRMWLRPPMRSFISITNCGIAEDYGETVAYTIQLFNSRGEEPMSYHGSLAAQATAYGPIDRFFPFAKEFLGSPGLGVAFVESQADLAVMHFSEHEVSGAVSGEHFLPSINYQDGKYHKCCGA